jgi:hypothetical protein
MFGFLKKVSRGSKTILLLQELLVPRLLDSIYFSSNKKLAIDLTKALYTEALIE